MKLFKKRGLDYAISRTIAQKGTYIGASAGAMIAGDSIYKALDFEKI